MKMLLQMCIFISLGLLVACTNKQSPTHAQPLGAIQFCIDNPNNERCQETEEL